MDADDECQIIYSDRNLPFKGLESNIKKKSDKKFKSNHYEKNSQLSEKTVKKSPFIIESTQQEPINLHTIVPNSEKIKPDLNFAQVPNIRNDFSSYQTKNPDLKLNSEQFPHTSSTNQVYPFKISSTPPPLLITNYPINPHNEVQISKPQLPTKLPGTYQPPARLTGNPTQGLELLSSSSQPYPLTLNSKESTTSPSDSLAPTPKFMNPGSVFSKPNLENLQSNKIKPEIKIKANNEEKIMIPYKISIPTNSMPTIIKHTKQGKISNFINLLIKNIDVETVLEQKDKLLNLHQNIKNEFPNLNLDKNKIELQCLSCKKFNELYCLKCGCVFCKSCMIKFFYDFYLSRSSSDTLLNENKKCPKCSLEINSIEEETLLKFCNLNKFKIEKEAKLQRLNMEEKIFCSFCLKKKRNFDLNSCLHACLDCEARALRMNTKFCKVCQENWDLDSFELISFKCTSCYKDEKVEKGFFGSLGKFLHSEKCCLCVKCCYESLNSGNCLSCNKELRVWEKIEINSHIFFICPSCDIQEFRGNTNICSNCDTLLCKRCFFQICPHCNT